MQQVHRKEEDQLKALKVSSLLVWLPHVFALVYTSTKGSVSATKAPFFLFLIAMTMFLTFYVATKKSGDYLMVLSALVGLSVELLGFGMGEDTDRFSLPNNAWIFITGAHGLFSGILCKAKDIHDGRYRPDYSLAERLYIVFPFALGLWFGYVVHNGWSGLVTVYISIFFCLTVVGYGVAAQRLLKYMGVFDGDLIGLVTRLFTSSFGVVLFTLLTTFFLVVYLAIPFLTHLWSLNGLVSSIGIIVEVVMYDMA